VDSHSHRLLRASSYRRPLLQNNQKEKLEEIPIIVDLSQHSSFFDVIFGNTPMIDRQLLHIIAVALISVFTPFSKVSVVQPPSSKLFLHLGHG
jgi:hypothetical protein